MQRIALIFYTFLLPCISWSQNWKQYPYSPENSVISFPFDEGRHPDEPIEWWYVAGHLTGNETGNNYSFMLTYFYSPAYGFDGFRIFNLANDDTGLFFNDSKAVFYPVMSQESLHIQALITPDTIETWTNLKDNDDQLIPFSYAISARAAHGSLDLEFHSLKPPLILGDSGLFQQGNSSTTYYYSLTTNEASGTIHFNGMEEEVTGSCWVDRQYGDFNPIIEEKYEWFFIQLSNGMDLNIWNLFTAENQLPDTSTFKYLSVNSDSANPYTTSDFEVERLGFQYMPDSAVVYSRKWRLTSTAHQMDLMITSRHKQSEVQQPIRFFEGSTDVSGKVNDMPVTGIGFAELLKTYEKPNISITSPAGETWKDTIPIIWRLSNPDDGLGVLYDLFYRTDRDHPFLPLDQALEDTIYHWTDPPLNSGDSCWFKVMAYSGDTTLQQSAVTPVASIFYRGTTGKDDPAQFDSTSNLIRLYPNPVKDLLTVALPAIHPYLICQLIDLNGKVRGQYDISNQPEVNIETAALTAGEYVIWLHAPHATSTARFMVQ